MDQDQQRDSAEERYNAQLLREEAEGPALRTISDAFGAGVASVLDHEPQRDLDYHEGTPASAAFRRGQSRARFLVGSSRHSDDPAVRDAAATAIARDCRYNLAIEVAEYRLSEAEALHEQVRGASNEPLAVAIVGNCRRIVGILREWEAGSAREDVAFGSRQPIPGARIFTPTPEAAGE